MPLSFSMTETMSGLHHFVDPARGDAYDRRFYFRLDWGARRAAQLNPLAPEFLELEARGYLFCEGLTDGEAPCAGMLKLDYLGRHTITYVLDFEVAGASYHFVGEKIDVDLRRPLQLIKTHTTCYGTLTDAAGKVVSRSVTHFEPETLLPFLASFRIGFGG
jgi:hypothetical protein